MGGGRTWRFDCSTVFHSLKRSHFPIIFLIYGVSILYRSQDVGMENLRCLRTSALYVFNKLIPPFPAI